MIWEWPIWLCSLVMCKHAPQAPEIFTKHFYGFSLNIIFIGFVFLHSSCCTVLIIPNQTYWTVVSISQIWKFDIIWNEIIKSKSKNEIVLGIEFELFHSKNFISSLNQNRVYLSSFATHRNYVWWSYTMVWNRNDSNSIKSAVEHWTMWIYSNILNPHIQPHLTNAPHNQIE